MGCVSSFLHYTPVPLSWFGGACLSVSLSGAGNKEDGLYFYFLDFGVDVECGRDLGAYLYKPLTSALPCFTTPAHSGRSLLFTIFSYIWRPGKRELNLEFDRIVKYVLATYPGIPRFACSHERGGSTHFKWGAAGTAVVL